MTSETAERVRINPPYATARPVLSVLIPYYRDDPSDLLRALDREAPKLHGAVEIVLLDDGTNIPAHASRVEQQVAALRLPVRFVQLAQNEGRAKARDGWRHHGDAPGGSLPSGQRSVCR